MKNRQVDHVSHQNDQAEVLPASSPDEKALVTTGELAMRLGVSRQTIDRARREGRLKGVPYGKGFAFRRTETLEVGVDLRKENNTIARAKYEGERDAQVIEMLEANATIAEIVITTKVPHEIVVSLRAAWRKSRDVELKDRPAVCSCGAPSDPRVAMCIACFRRVPIPALTDAQIRLLKGQPAMSPETCECTGCGEAARNDAAMHVCERCSLAIVLQNNALAIVLGDRVVRALTPHETQVLVKALGAKETDAPSPETSPEVPTFDAPAETLSKSKLDELLHKYNLRGKE